MTATVILPSIDPAYTAECIATMRFVNPADVPVLYHSRDGADVVDVNGVWWINGKPDVRLVVIYNTPQHNLGVAGSWNVGIEKMYEHGHDWLVILSAGVRFGPAGGTDFLRFLDEARKARPSPPLAEAANNLGWHCLAFSREVLDLVGPFDPIFHPGYYEDRDWSVRFQRAHGVNANARDFRGPLWPKVDIDARLDSIAHGIKRGGVVVDFVAMEAAFTAKWGHDEEFATPYDDPALGWQFTGPCATVSVE